MRDPAGHRRRVAGAQRQRRLCDEVDVLGVGLGDLNLDSLFGGVDAVGALDPGAAFTSGFDAATEAATSAASAIDPLSFLGL